METDEKEVELSENNELVMMNQGEVVSNIPKSVNLRHNVLEMLDEDGFKQMLKIGRTQFMQLLDLIKDDTVFNNANSNKQFTVEVQLAIVLFRLVSSAENATISKIASIFGIGGGGSLGKITNRVFTAILNLTPKFIYWPDESERSQIEADTFHELPYCIGYIGGTEIALEQIPVVNAEQYFSENRIYAIKVQVICDYKLRIRHLVVGHPGSWSDSSVYKDSTVFKNKEDYFSWQQWIAGNSAYPLSENLITPYKSNSRRLDRDAKIKFNLRHSSYRVRVEHCFRQLKEKFCSLKQYKMRLVRRENVKFCCAWVVVCCTLHNFLKTTEETSCTSDIQPVKFEEFSVKEEEAEGLEEEEDTPSISAGK